MGARVRYDASSETKGAGVADEYPRTTGSWQRTVVDDEETETPTLRMARKAAPHRSAQAARNARAGDAVAETRSSYRRTSSRYTTKGRRTKRTLIRLGIALAILLAVAGILFGLARWIGLIGAGTQSEDDPTLIPLRSRGKEAELPVVNVDTLISGLMELGAADDEPAVFSFTKKDFSLSSEEWDALVAATGAAQAKLRPAAEESADAEDEEPADAAEADDDSQVASVPDDTVAFIALDLEESRGVAFNLDAYVEGAQSIKALFATYFASQFLDSAKASIETEGAEVALCLDDAQDALYEKLRATYDEYGWDAWIGGVGARSCVASAGNFPLVTTRMDARAWLNVYRYLTGGTYGATWLAQQLESSSGSISERALSTTHTIQAGEDETYTISPVAAPMTIWSFAGHANSAADQRYCLVENAIVLVDGHSYLLSVLTALPDTTANRELAENIMAAAAQCIIHVDVQTSEDESESAAA